METGSCHLIHVCCAPDLVVAHISGARGDLFFYNPNIAPVDEYERRLAEVLRVSELLDYRVVNAPYEPHEFSEAIAGLETEPEGGMRCVKCVALRLSKTAKVAHAMGYKSFSTTLTASPRKDVDVINEVGKKISNVFRVEYLPNVYRKTPLFGDARRLVRQLGIYRQRYCGCVFSQRNSRLPLEV